MTMQPEQAHILDPETLELFAQKGLQGGPEIRHVGNVNAVKVRRIMQLIRDLAKAPFPELKVLDLACGEGLYAIEAALRGADVLAIDAREERMSEGRRAGQRLGLNKLRFEQNDVRKVSLGSHGAFDIVLFLGILYHLDASDIFPVLTNLHGICQQFLIIDTHIALTNPDRVRFNDQDYEGTRVREHADQDADEVRRGRLLASLDNAWSFIFTRESLVRLLGAIGFTAVLECLVPLEAGKPQNRVTLLATKGMPVQLSSYPWINQKSEAEIEAALQPMLKRQSVAIAPSPPVQTEPAAATAPTGRSVSGGFFERWFKT